MILQLDERIALIDVLRVDFDPDDLSNVLEGLDRRLHDIIIPTGVNYPKVVETVVATAEQEGWTWALITAAIKGNPGAPNLQGFLQQYPHLDARKALPPTALDLFQSHSLRGGRIFIDRLEFREALGGLREKNGSRVLVITGERGGGKTYSRELLNFFASNTPNHKVVYADLDRFQYGPMDLAETIAMQIGQSIANVPQQQDEQRARWVLKLCDAITQHMANSSNMNYWCIFDGFREQTLLSETKSLIQELAVRADTTLPQCRLILLNYQEDLPLDYVSREKIRAIGRAELLEFFRQVNVANQNKHTDEYLGQTIDVILAQIQQMMQENPDKESQRLRFLNKAVDETVRLLYQ